jgi:hypothetical protein
MEMFERRVNPVRGGRLRKMQPFFTVAISESFVRSEFWNFRLEFFFDGTNAEIQFLVSPSQSGSEMLLW